MAPDNIDEKTRRERKEVRSHVVEAEYMFFLSYSLVTALYTSELSEL